MGDEFDIEAYLEAAVDKRSQESTEKLNHHHLPESTSSSTHVNNDRHDDRDVMRDHNGDRGREKDYRHGNRSRDRDRDRDRRRRSRSRERRRSRSRSGGRRHRRERDDRRRSRSGDRRDRRRDSDRDRDRDRDREEREATVADDAATKAKKEADKKQKAIDDLTKDQRTVFISQLTMKVDEKMVRDYFLQIGEVNNVIMIRDKYTGRHKGFSYVEMKDLESIPTCLLLNGVAPDFQKFPILVKASEAEKNFLAKKEAAAVAPTHASMGQDGAHIYGPGSMETGGNHAGGDRRVYIGNLHVNISEEDLTAVLQEVGPVDSVHINRDEVGTSKGYAFASFMRFEDAQKAQTTLSGIELAGRAIKVGSVTDGGNSNAQVGVAGGSQQLGSSNWKLDDDEGSGMQMNSQSRSMLMAKLGKAAGIDMPQPAPVAPLPPPSEHIGGLVTPATAPPVTGQISTCFVINNMFKLEEETEDGWADDIKEDVTAECQKFGAVQHCHVEQNRPGGLVYMRFSTSQAAAAAATSLNGRWFAGRMITVGFIEPQAYATLFVSA